MAKKYRVSANLLDFYALQNAPYGMIGTSSCNHVLELTLDANTAYTCVSNGTGSTSGSADDNRSIYFDNSDATNVVYVGRPVTVTTGTDGKVKIGFFSSRANAQQYINNTAQVWLVKGSIALPYEPYGNTWNELTPKIYNTSTDTISTLPTDIIPDGQPISGITIKGNMQQTGTPSPSAPIYPAECGNKTANLCDIGNFANSTTDTRNSLQLAIMCYHDNEFIGRATFSGGAQLLDILTTGNKQILFTVNAANCNRLSIKHNGATRDIPIGNVYGAFSGNYVISFDCNGVNPTIIDGISLENIMLNSGSTALPYEQHGYKIPVSCGLTTVTAYTAEPIRKIDEYADSKTLTQETRNIKKYEFTGQESWIVYNNDYWSSVVDNDAAPNRSCICSHLISTITAGIWISSGRSQLKVSSSSVSSVSSDLSTFKAWLAQQYTNGTPVTMWYVLATPTTETVSMPEIPTTAGSQQFDIDTTLKPSEVSLTYHGWHDKTDKEYSGGEWS